MKTALQVGTAGWASSWVPFYEKAGWRLGGVVSRSEEALTRFREKHGAQIPGYTDYASALEGDFDAVVISTPHNVHVPLAIQALRAGKAVLVEKPLADNFAAALELARVAREANGLVMVSQNFRYREPLWRLRETCRALGRISALRVEMVQEYPSYLKKLSQRNRISSLLEEVFVHQADQARFILGSDPVRVYAHAWADAWDETGQANNADVLVEFACGARFNYHGSWSNRGVHTTWAGTWRVRAEYGTIDWDGTDEGGLRLHASKDRPLTILEPKAFPGFDRSGVLREFSTAIDEGRRPACDLQDNLQSYGLVAAALLSFEQRRPVEMKELFE